MDYMAEEQEHGITITSAVTKAPWGNHLLQIVDTPGHVDFTIEVERSMRVLDGCIIVLDGVRGVEPQTETVWRQRSRFNLPGLFFVNKLDRPGADFGHALESVRRRLGAEPVAITVPLEKDSAVVHLIDRTLLRFEGEQGEAVTCEPCPDRIWEELTPYRENLLLAAAEADEALADRVLAGEQPEADEIWRALRAATLAGRLFPCFGGSALRNRGVQPLLDGVVRLLPAPLDRPSSTASIPGGGDEDVAMTMDGPLVALAFKVQLWEGRRHVFVRVYRNRLRAGDTVAFVSADGRETREQVARIFDVDAGKKTRLDVAWPGQIALVGGLRFATTGDTLCDPGHIVVLERIETRKPVISLAIEPAASADEEKFLEILGKVLQEDPTLRLDEDPETGQRLLRGMGELHLQIVLERLEREFNLHVRSGKPAVAVRETLVSPAGAEFLFHPPPVAERKALEIKARVSVQVRPRSRGTGILTRLDPAVEPAGSKLSAEQAAALEQGVRFALSAGPREGAPLEDVEVIVTEVELFGSASTPDALSAAASRALNKAIESAGSVLLVPIMQVEVVVPEDNLGTVLGDLQSRQALIRNTETWGETVTIDCEVALSQLLGYTTNLRSLTQGRGQFSMIFNRFDTL